MSVLTITSPTFLEDAALIAESIVVQSGKESEPHWDESAKNFIEGVIAFVASSPEFDGNRDLIQVRECIKRALWMSEEENGEEINKSTRPILCQEMMRVGAALAKDAGTQTIGSALIGAAMDFYSKRDGEQASVYSTVNRHTKFLDYAAFRNVLQDSDFNLAELKRNPMGVTIYLCFPATRADLSRRRMRIFVNQLLDAMDREKTKPAAPNLRVVPLFEMTAQALHLIARQLERD